MSSIFCNLILDHLNELLEDDFEIFKGHLMRNMADGFVPIQRYKLEKARRLKVMELMVDQYEPTQAANITVKILQRMGQNQLSRELEEKLTAKGLEGKTIQQIISKTHHQCSLTSVHFLVLTVQVFTSSIL